MPEPVAGDQDPAAPAEAGPRRQRWVRGVAIVVGVLSLVPAGFCLFMAWFLASGMYSWSQPEFDPVLVMLALGASLSLSTGPVVMMFGQDRRRWLVVTAATFLTVFLLSSLATWLPLLGPQG